MLNNIINIGNSQKEKIETKELKIARNVFIIRESVIALKNISMISVAKESKETYNLISFIMVLLGLAFLSVESVISSIESVTSFVGLVFVCVGIWSIYSTYKKNLDRNEYIILELNSGKNMYIYCEEHSFAIEVVDVIINCINSGQEAIINMKECKIEKCQFGNDNLMMESEYND